ncbi:DUF2059 domain-containing protein [Archangium minus]|uniref:DUF2059 domain-containing protein n=1 Tax=Archangium minus TaxID=83450 RepID=A0ABY9WG81_9BACT|nr:DUF2059 domain-containing protein [Archangium minus]
MRSFKSRVSWRWSLLAVLVVGCAHSGAGTTEAPAAASESSAAKLRKEQKVRQLMALTGAEDTGRQMIDMMTGHFQQMSKIPPGFMEKFREMAAQESIVDLLVPVYMKNFSEEDLDAAIAFHGSPAGKRFLAAQPVLLQEAKAVGEQWGVRLAEKTLQALAEEAREQQSEAVSHEGQQL